MADETPGTTPGEVIGHAEPDTGQGDAASSEIPEGVDALSSEQISGADERGGDDDGALDVSAMMDDAGDAGDAGDADDADDAGAADAEGSAADDAGDDAPEKTDEEAQAAPDTGEAG